MPGFDGALADVDVKGGPKQDRLDQVVDEADDERSEDEE
jgi:hypothetical protein